MWKPSYRGCWIHSYLDRWRRLDDFPRELALPMISQCFSWRFKGSFPSCPGIPIFFGWVEHHLKWRMNRGSIFCSKKSWKHTSFASCISCEDEMRVNLNIGELPKKPYCWFLISPMIFPSGDPGNFHHLPRPSGEGRWEFPFLADRRGGSLDLWSRPREVAMGQCPLWLEVLILICLRISSPYLGKKTKKTRHCHSPRVIKHGLPDISSFRSMVFPHINLHG